MKATSADREYGVAPPGYRLPNQTHLGRVHLQVSNLDQSIAYYRDVLGLRVLQSDPTSASLGSHGSERVLVELHERRGIRRVPRGGLLGLYHFAILLPNRASLGRFIRQLLTLGVQFGSADHFVSESTYLWDPDGLGIEVYADRPPETWRARGRELVMGTEALDVQEVTAAGATAPWVGMPRGTTLGHMHLSVSDLARARDLYHSALGFDRVVWSYPGALFMSAGGYHHHLGTNTWAAGARPATEDDARLLEWELLLPQQEDVEAAAATVGRAGYDTTADGDGRVLTDPWGTRVRLVRTKN